MAETGISRRGWQLAAAAIVAVAFVGFFTGLKQPPVVAPVRDTRDLAPEADPTRSYKDLRSQDRGALGDLHPAQVERFVDGLDRTPPKGPPDEASFANAIAAREETRAYWGAPPSIPHQVNDTRAPDCLTCHDKGANIAGKIAPQMSHPRYDSCLQCHVLSQDPRAGGDAGIAPENTFDGWKSPGHGSRAWSGAPPTMPHPTRMRETCISCHGPSGKVGLRTSHPERQNCVQCHASSATLDQRASTNDTPTGK